MLRIRIILMSVLFLLFVGVNKNVRAAIDSAKLVQKSTDEDQSKKESQNESEEQITHLDFFGAFSLVNVQLQWRDLESGLSDEESKAELSVNQKELYLEQAESFSSNDKGQIVSNSHATNTGNGVLPVSVFRTIEGTTHFTYLQNKQDTSTIAYILNCGTYPKSC